MKKLWIFAAGLGLFYLLVYGAISMDKSTVPVADGSPTMLATGNLQTTTLVDRAKADAVSRTEPNAKLTVVSAVPARFTGDTLTPTRLTDTNGTPGSIITLVAEVNGKEVSQLIYHVTAEKLVFVRQEVPKH